MSMLGADEIRKQQKSQNILIEPFNDSQINPNSYDVRMGEWVIEPRFGNAIIDLENPDSAKLIWGTPRNLKREQVVILPPHGILLAHTAEVIGSYKYGTLLKARSTISRSGIDVCASAGFGDVGYVNHWTLELTNNSKNHIALKPGMRLAQIAFIEVKNPGQYEGAYKQVISSDFETINWRPEQMLPILGQLRVF